MKINDLNKIEEGLGRTLFGALPAAAVSGAFSGKGTKHTLVQNEFLQDFIQDAITSLDNGIRGGIVDPKSTKDPFTDETKPKKPGPETPPGPGPAPIERTKGQIVTLGGKDYRWEGAQWVDTITGRIVDKATAEKLSRLPTAPLTKGKIAKLGSRAYRWEGAQWVDTGTGKIANKEIAQKLTAMFAPPSTTESKYDKMNRIFESILEAGDPEADSGKMSIAEYMLSWFDQYMRGVNWRTRMDIVSPIIQNIQSTYRKDKGKSAINRLAQAGYALSKASPKMPKGAEDISGSEGTETPAPGDSEKVLNKLTKLLDSLKSDSPDTYKKLITDLVGELTKRKTELETPPTPTPGPAPAPTPTPTPTPTPESRKRK